MMKRCSFSLPVAATSASNCASMDGVMAGKANKACKEALYNLSHPDIVRQQL